jgi:hypothetical protein
VAIEREWLEAVEQLMGDQGLADVAQVSLLEAWRQRVNSRIPEDTDLRSACKYAGDCWSGDHGGKPDQMRVRLPWIGPRYPVRRIAVVAINARDSGAPDAEVKATLGVVECLRQNRRGYGPNGRSFFHYRIASAVHAAMQSQDRRPVEKNPPPAQVVEAVLCSARLQAVQCAPCSTARRSPTPAMVRNCPGFLLREQRELLAPEVLMLFGQPAHRAIEEPQLDMTWDTTWEQSGRCFSRGQTNLAGLPLTVCAFAHPSTAKWSTSWRRFRESIIANPLAPAIRPSKKRSGPEMSTAPQARPLA